MVCAFLLFEYKNGVTANGPPFFSAYCLLITIYYFPTCPTLIFPDSPIIFSATFLGTS